MRFANSSFQAPPLTKINKILIVGIVFFFLIHSILKAVSGVYLSQFLSLSGGFFFSGHLYQLITYPLMATGLFEVLFDCLLLWFIGGELELLWGSNRYLKYIAVSTLFGGLIFLAISSFLSAWTYLSGPGGMCLAILVAYAILFPDRSLLLVFFPVKAKWFCLIMAGILLYQGVFLPGAAGVWGQLGAMASGFIYLIFLARNALKLPGFLTRKKKKSNPGLKIVRGDNDDQGPKMWH